MLNIIRNIFSQQAETEPTEEELYQRQLERNRRIMLNAIYRNEQLNTITRNNPHPVNAISPNISINEEMIVAEYANYFSEN